MTDRRITILCVDDHPIVRDGVELIVARQPDMEVVADAATGAEAIERYREHRPEVVLMDLHLGSPMSGVDAIREIRREDPAARIIVLTVAQGEEDIHRALEAGAMTYLFKDTVSKDLVGIIRSVYEGVSTLRPDVAARLRDRAGRSAPTQRELDVLGLMAEGLRNREIAEVLGITEETVQSHVRAILAKFEAKDRTAAVRIALRRGFIHV